MDNAKYGEVNVLEGGCSMPAIHKLNPKPLHPKPWNKHCKDVFSYDVTKHDMGKAVISLLQQPDVIQFFVGLT